MGMCDIIPGISGGTIAFITGIYEKLVHSITLFNKSFFLKLITLKIKEALKPIPLDFLIPLFSGIMIAIFSAAKLVHFLLEYYAIYTWSLFFGLILASVFHLSKEIDFKNIKQSLFFIFGVSIGFVIVGLIPVSTPENYLFIFFSGIIGITAMILPGISGSFILLILGKYEYITGAVKAPFAEGNLLILSIFAIGCLIGLLSFSKLLNILLERFKPQMFALLTGFILGALRKIWPWKEILEAKIIRGKTHIVSEANTLPSLSNETYLAISICLISFVAVMAILSLEKRKPTAI